MNRSTVERSKAQLLEVAGMMFAIVTLAVRWRQWLA
jgi:hypothetical protein